MENRKIILVDSATNSKVTLTTDCTTFGELKTLARQAGVDFDGKDWLEGLTKTQPVSDDSLLPTNVNYKGTVTNNLVYMITNTNKKTKSGVDRIELYSMIKKYGIADAIKAKYGKSFTNIKTDILANEVAIAISQSTSNNETTGVSYYEKKYNALVYGVACLLANIDADTANAIQEEYDKIVESENNASSDINFSDADLKAMFK